MTETDRTVQGADTALGDSVYLIAGEASFTVRGMGHLARTWSKIAPRLTRILGGDARIDFISSRKTTLRGNCKIFFAEQNGSMVSTTTRFHLCV